MLLVSSRFKSLLSLKYQKMRYIASDDRYSHDDVNENSDEENVGDEGMEKELNDILEKVLGD